MPNFQVGNTPSRIALPYATPFLIQNDGAATIYLGRDSSLSPSARSYTLVSGGTLHWAEGVELWACTDVGSTGSINILYDGNNPAVPGPATVTVDGTVGIDGPVDVNLLGSLIMDSNGFCDPGSNLQFGIPDVSDYASLLIVFTPTTIVSGFPDLSQLLDMRVNWNYTQGSGGLQLAEDEFMVSPWGQAYMRLQVKSQWLAMVLNGFSNTARVFFNVKVYGYKVTLPEAYRNLWLSDTQTQGWTGTPTIFSTDFLMTLAGVITRTAAGTTAALALLSHYSGAAQVPFMRLNPTASTPAMSMGIQASTPGSLVLFNRSASALNDTNDQEIYLPRMPVYVRATSGFVANPSTAHFSLTVEYKGINNEH